MSNTIGKQQREALKEAAQKASGFAHTPNSGFVVGAAVLGKDGRIVAGCNVESIISGLGTCAERNAIYQAVAQGLRDPIAVAVYAPTDTPITPCGMCRQTILEMAPNAQVLCFDKHDKVLEFTQKDLLPAAFELVEQ